MKLEPLSVILNKNFIPNKKFYFIGGNEFTLMEKVKNNIVDNYLKIEKASIIYIDNVDNFIDNGGLFENKKIFLVNSIKGVEEEVLISLRKTGGIFIFSQENSSKTKRVKNIFLKNMDSYLFDCYELDRGSKIKILNYFLEQFELNIEEDVYWFLVEKLENKYVFLENSLNKILKLDPKEINLNNVKRLLTVDSSQKEKLFFKLLKKNSEIVEDYRQKIVTKSDVDELYYYCRFFCQLVIDNDNVEDYNKKIPVYLFREKRFLFDFFKRYNLKKKKLLVKLLSSTEQVLRKENNLSIIFGLRFFLNIKKITIS
tara:strand:- start:482 stop:1420 length:939 start_codon:yes stop_codon:yes gene_type:complete